MLTFVKILDNLKKIFLSILIVITMLMFYMKYKMYTITTNLAYLDKQIEKKQEEYHILNIELCYLSSTERLLSLVNKYPSILYNKSIAKYSQLKSKDELEKLSLAKIRGMRDFPRLNVKRNKI